MTKIKMIKQEKINGDVYIKIYINEECVKVFYETEYEEAKLYYKKCFNNIKTSQYPKITLLKNETIN